MNIRNIAEIITKNKFEICIRYQINENKENIKKYLIYYFNNLKNGLFVKSRIK